MKLHTSHINAEYYTERNKIILIMLSNGHSVDEVADKVCLSSWRIKGLVKQMCATASCRNTRHLIATALRKGVIK